MQSQSTNINSDGVLLSKDDVDRLLQSPSDESKIEVLNKVSSNYNQNSLNESEIELAEQIFRLLVRDSAVKIRASLAESLKSNTHVPKDIVLKLAEDDELVSKPIISMSEVLDDIDLLNIIRNSEEVWRYLAVAKRPDVSEQVSDELVNVKHSEVTSALLDNHGARISEKSFDEIARQASADDSVAQKLIDRPALPMTVVSKLSSALSQNMAEQLQQKYHIDETQASEGAKAAGEHNILEIIAQHTDEDQTNQLVAQLHQDGLLSSSLVINALCHGNMPFFEASLAALSGVPLKNTKLLIADKGKLGFRALYNKAALPQTMFRAMRLLLVSVREVIEAGQKPGSRQFSNSVVQKMLEASQNEKIENLSYILALLRQQANPSF